LIIFFNTQSTAQLTFRRNVLRIVGLHIVDKTGIILWANKAELDILGYTPEEYIGKPIKDFHADQNVVNRVLGILLSGGKVESIVSPIRCKDGHIEYMEINSTMRKDVNGKCTTTRCFSACVTDRILKERAQIEAMARKKEAEIIQEETRKKTDFLRKLCHELRNPLAGITGNLELLLEELMAADAVGGRGAAEEEGEGNHHGSDVVSTTEESSGQKATATLASTASQSRPSTTTTSPALLQDPRNTSTSKLAYVRERVQNALDYAKNAQLAAEHQMLVINDTLSLSKLESSTGFDFHPKPVDLERLLDGVVAVMGVKAKEKGLALNVDTVQLERARFVKTDIGWIKQVLINLVGNSLKFTQHGHVSISVKALEQNEEDKKHDDDESMTTLEVTIQDTGIGMTEEEQSNLFRPFSQANDMISTDYGGSGLGLHIVKQVLDHLNGNIQVESEKGVGSTFRFTLPCGVVTPQELSTLLSNRPTAPTTSKMAAAYALLPSPSAQGKRVLVVDDIEVNRKILSSYLRRKGYIVEVAVHGQMGLYLHRQNPFDLILTDIDMPVMDGHEMTRRIRQDEEAAQNVDATTAPPVPIIGISGHVSNKVVSLVSC
jgi:PAS domain S-box-containing protein